MGSLDYVFTNVSSSLLWCLTMLSKGAFNQYPPSKDSCWNNVNDLLLISKSSEMPYQTFPLESYHSRWYLWVIWGWPGMIRRYRYNGCKFLAPSLYLWITLYRFNTGKALENANDAVAWSIYIYWVHWDRGREQKHQWQSTRRIVDG